jgi:hypothetical protein
MKIFLEYSGENRYWKYYYYDSENYRTTTEGFKNHILATNHAKNIFGEQIEIIDKW